MNDLESFGHVLQENFGGSGGGEADPGLDWRDPIFEKTQNRIRFSRKPGYGSDFQDKTGSDLQDKTGPVLIEKV